MYLKFIEEEGRTDLVGLEPEIAGALVRGTYTAQYIQANYHDTYIKDSYYRDCTGFSLRQADGLLTVWFD